MDSVPNHIESFGILAVDMQHHLSELITPIKRPKRDLKKLLDLDEDNHGLMVSKAAAEVKSEQPASEDTKAADTKATDTKKDAALRWLEIVDGSTTDDSKDTSSESHQVLVVKATTNDYIRAYTNPLNLISVMGPTRSGKSTLMNLLAGCTDSELFPTSPGATPITKGIDLGNKIMTVEKFSTLDSGDKVQPQETGQKIGFLDSEGQGDEDDKYDVTLFTPAIICSRIVVYNTTETAKNTILKELTLMTLIANKIKLSEKEDVNQPKFGDLMIIINKYTLGTQSDTESIRKAILDDEKGTSETVTKHNSCRKILRAQFKSISVHLLLGDSLKDGVKDKINEKEKKFLTLTDFKDNYVKDFKALRKAFSERLKTPRIVAGNRLSGQSIAALVVQIVATINKAEPLHILDLWQQAENADINKATLKFREDLAKSCHEIHNWPKLLSTWECTKKLDSIIEDLLNSVQRSLAYLSPERIKKVRQDLFNDAQKPKAETLATNLIRLQSYARMTLNNFVTSLSKRLSDSFPENLVSTEFAKAKLESLKTSLLKEYEESITRFDSQALPSDYKQTYLSGFSIAEVTTRETISQAWVAWVIEKDKKSLEILSNQLATHSSNKAESLTSWDIGAATICSSNLSDYNNTIDLEYLWDGKAAVKLSYAGKADKAIALARAQHKLDVEEEKKLIDNELTREITSYEDGANNSLVPQTEPGDYSKITDASQYRTAFKTFMEMHKIGETLVSTYLNNFDNQVSNFKTTFKIVYTDAVSVFLNYLKDELVLIVKSKLAAFKLNTDKIVLTKDLLRSSLDSSLKNCSTLAMNEFNTEAKKFMVTQSAGENRLTTARNDLSEKVTSHRLSKFLLLQAMVENHNRTLLSKITTPILQGVVDFTITSVPTLTTKIEEAKTDFYYAACGETTEKDEMWKKFQEKTPGLYKNVQRSNGIFVGKISGISASTSEMEGIVMFNVASKVASLANLLGMSWISGSTQFSRETVSQGRARSHLYRNQEKPDGYDNTHCTNLRFESWKVEFSDFVFDDPTVQELQPFTIQSMEGPQQDTDAQVDVSLSRTLTESITNSNTMMFQMSSEYSASGGVEGVASAAVKMAFQASGSWTNTKENTVTFDVNFKYPILCPANRKTKIDCIGFKQRSSVTYTAKAKLIPKVIFTGGFTRWGGDNNEHPNFYKGYSRQRYYGDIDCGYLNELKSKAASNADPWSWNDAIKKYPYIQTLVDDISNGKNYEMYVRGKWEGITGWKHMIERKVSVE